MSSGFKMRPYQKAAVEGVQNGWEEYSKQLAILPTGAGKSCIFSWLADQEKGRTLILAHREELIDQAIEKLHKTTGIYAGKEKAEFKASHSHGVVVASVQSMIRRLDRWPADHFDLVVCDEAHHCFPWGTKILTDKGLKPIGSVCSKRSPFKVASINKGSGNIEFKKITNWFQKNEKKLLRITHEKGSLECTKDHKIWTTNGYVRAEDIAHGMCLRVLQNAIPSDKRLLEAEKVLRTFLPRKVDSIKTRSTETLGRKQKRETEEGLQMVREGFFTVMCRRIRQIYSFLFKEMFCGVGSYAAFSERGSKKECPKDAQSMHRDETSRDFKKNEKIQPDASPGVSGKNEEKTIRKNFSGSRWKQQNHKTSKNTTQDSWFTYGASNQDIPRERGVSKPSDSLQGGFSLPGIENCNRGGRELTQIEKVEIPRPTENGYFEFSRVVGIEVLEQGSERGNRKSCERDQRVYDIEVEGNHNYFADGVLVSNSISKSWLKVLNHFDEHANVLGVTATPDRGDKRNLGSYYENIAYEVSMMDLVRDGYLSPITIKTCPIKLDIRGVHKRVGDYDANELGESLTPYLEQIADAILEHAAFRRTLVFLPLIATSKAFVEICRSKGIIAEHVDGYSEDRKEKLAAFANGQFDLMSNAMLLTEGFDDPGIECVVNLRPTQSRSLFAQIVGRGTRVAAGKENLLLLDFLWQHEKHNLIRPAHLIAESDEIADIMTEISENTGGQGELELEGLASDAQVQREKKLREIIKEREHEESKLLDAMDFCSQMGDESPGWENTKQWHSKGITSSQEKILTKAGINLKSVKGKGHASKLIDLYLKHEGAKPASDKQKTAMKRANIPNAENATRAEAKQFFAIRNKHRAV